MKKPATILYFDCVSGISGDMSLGALVDLGVEITVIEEGLKGLALDGYKLRVSREKRSGIEGTRLIVETADEAPERSYADIRTLIEESALAENVKELSLEIFEIIAVAEARVHGVEPDEVQFHEVGAVDSIVDIVGSAIAIKSLNIDAVYASAVPLGSGLVDTSHGTMPVPAPATVEILKGVPVLPGSVKAELTTPTGAAILKALSKGFGPPPAMTIERIGYGIGSKTFKELPNVLRLFSATPSGSGEASGAGPDKDAVIVIETNIDDLSPQIAGFLMDRLFEAGALDVWFTPVQMKKSRPGFLLTAIVSKERQREVMDVIFIESTSIGVRFHTVLRETLERTEFELDTRFGLIRVKASTLDGRVVNRQPEYEDLKAASIKSKVPLKSVRDEVMALVLEDERKEGKKP
ncbi:MAG: nickel pincer cofactor biosynthesis protein LarC [Thermodesulfobacteriota bacterium]